MSKGQINIMLRFQPTRDSSDAVLFNWLRRSSLLPLKEAVLLPCRAFWNPIAFRVMGKPRSECYRVCQDSLAALNAQIELVRVQLKHLELGGE
jgi:hypothetical protein